MKKILPVLLSGIWISLSEFFRNEFLLKAEWTKHYESLGLGFPGGPLNGAVWGLWSLIFAAFIYAIQQRFNFYETLGITWVAGFIMMWLVIGNMMVLPFSILPYAIPLSILEIFVALKINLFFTKKPK